jgi:hypothetical protein
VGVLNAGTKETQHIVSPRKSSLTNWTLHVGGFPSPVITSSYKLLAVFYENEAGKKRDRP